MPPTGKLGIRDAVPMGKDKPFDPAHPLDRDATERLVNTADWQRLKNPGASETDLPAATFERSTGSPFIPCEKHTTPVVANQEVFDAINPRLQTFTPKIVL